MFDVVLINGYCELTDLLGKPLELPLVVLGYFTAIVVGLVPAHLPQQPREHKTHFHYRAGCHLSCGKEVIKGKGDSGSDT